MCIVAVVVVVVFFKRVSPPSFVASFVTNTLHRDMLLLVRKGLFFLLCAIFLSFLEKPF